MRSLRDGRRTARPRPHPRWVGVGLVAGGLALAACSSNSTSSSTTVPSGSVTAPTSTAVPHQGSSSLQSVLSGITRTSNASFSSTYTTTDSSTGQSQTVTFAQAPPKSAVITSHGSFFINGSSVTECSGTGSAATCTSVPTSMLGSVNSLTALFSPGILTNTLKGIETQIAAHTAGVSVSTSSATYGGFPSTCITAKTSADPGGVTYCASDSNGILTYFTANGNSGTLTAYTANPPASTFSPPTGVTVQTLPAGA